MATDDGRKLFVAGLADSITEEVLRQLFEATGGSVLDVSLPKDRATGRPRGFGFVTLGSPEEADGALRQLDGSMQAGRSISVRPFKSEPPRRGEGRGADSSSSTSDRTLYVGNLPYDTNQAELEALFEGAGVGPLLRVHLPTDHDGRPRGFAFVTMGSSSAAQAAVDALQGADAKGRRLVVNIAHPRGERPRGGPSSGRGGPPSRDYGRSDGPSPSARGPGGGGFPPDEPRRTFDNDARRRSGDTKRKKKKHRGQRRSDGAEAAGKKSKNWRDWDDD